MSRAQGRKVKRSGLKQVGSRRQHLWAQSLLLLLLMSVPFVLPAQTGTVMCPVNPVPVVPTLTIDGFQRGDCNGDGGLDIADVVMLLSRLFAGGQAPPCEDGCDFNDDGALDIADAISGLSHLFSNSGPLPQPFGMCGTDPTDDTLVCTTFPCELTGTVVERRAHTLETGRVGVPYTGQLPLAQQREVRVTAVIPNTILRPRVEYIGFSLAPGQTLPLGLTLNGATGEITGVPQFAGFFPIDMLATTSVGDFVLYSVHLAVFSATEAEIDPNPNLAPPPGSVNITTGAFSYTHDLPWPPPYPLWDATLGVVGGMCPGLTAPPAPTETVVKQLRFYEPMTFAGPLPLVVFHHGAGYAFDDYDNLLRTLASRGVLCVSVNDTYSFQNYTSYYCWGGHDEAARVMIAAKEYLLSASACPTESLFDRIDPSQIFYAGHSRGGAAAIVAAEFDGNTRGVIALQPTDALSDSFIGTTNRWRELPDVPILNISVEQDIDVGFPYSERIFERFRGPSTMITIFGGCHGYTTNTSTLGCNICIWDMLPGLVDECRYIDRVTQQQITNNHVGAFVLRHAFGDLPLEGFLYGSNNQFSPLLSHAHRRNLGGAIRVDDFSNFPTNSLGFTTSTLPNVAFTVGPCYEFPTGAATTPPVAIDNLLVDIDTGSGTLYTSPLGTLGSPLDVSECKVLSFRIKNPDTPGMLDNFGFSWLDEFRVSVTDSFGNIAQVNVLSWLPNIVFHPQPAPPGAVTLKYQRFMTVEVPLSAFTAQDPALDITSLLVLDLTLSTIPSPTESILAIDEILFE